MINYTKASGKSPVPVKAAASVVKNRDSIKEKDEESQKGDFCDGIVNCENCKATLCSKAICDKHGAKDAGWDCCDCNNWFCEECLESLECCEYNSCVCCPICCDHEDCGTIYCEECSISHDKHCRRCNSKFIEYGKRKGDY